MRTRRLHRLALVLFSTTLIAACGETSDQEELKYAEPAEVNTGDEVNMAATADSGLVLINFQYEQGQENIAGSVMNSSPESYVNVQVVFHLFDAAGSQVGEVRDTTSEVRPGDLWTFGIPVPPERTVTRVEPALLRGTPRSLSGGQEVIPGSPHAAPGPTGPPSSEEGGGAASAPSPTP